MGGNAGGIAKDVLLYSSPLAPLKLASDTGAGKPAGKVAGSVAGEGANVMADILGQPRPGEEPPGLAPPVAMTDEQKKRERARLLREQEVSILTDRPGRGGTVLTSDYGLKL